MNFIKRSLVEKKTRVGLRAFRIVRALVRALLLSTLALYNKHWPANSSWFSVKLAGGAAQVLRQVWDLRNIVKDEDLNKIILNKLANRLGLKLLEL